jgi:hypothetical protein
VEEQLERRDEAAVQGGQTRRQATELSAAALHPIQDHSTPAACLSVGTRSHSAQQRPRSARLATLYISLSHSSVKADSTTGSAGSGSRQEWSSV